MHIRRLEGSVGPTKTGDTTKLSTSTVGVTSYARAHRKAPLSSISRRLDDMLSTSFDPHIISYKPPRMFLVPKFTMYDGTSDPFDHLLHYQQLMTLDIGNDVLLYKAFPASLHDLTLSWFHRLPQNSINSFPDVFEAFVNHYLCSTR